MSLCAKGLYPAGEGAGYAGGIMSAAVDGLRVAQAILSRYGALCERLYTLKSKLILKRDGG